MGRSPVLRKVTEEELVELFKGGRTIPQVAEIVERSPRTVERMRLRYGLSTPNPACGRRYTSEELARFQAMIDDGMSFEEIVKTTGVNWATLNRRFPGQAWKPAEVSRYGNAIRRIKRQARKQGISV